MPTIHAFLGLIFGTNCVFDIPAGWEPGILKIA